MKQKIKNILGRFLFVAGFLFVGSGMLEAVVIRLLSLVGW